MEEIGLVKHTLSNEKTFKSDVADTFALLISPRMIFVIPYILWIAISAAMYGGIFMLIVINSMKETQNDWSLQTKTKYGFLIFISLGVGEIIGSLLNGIIVDKKG